VDAAAVLHQPGLQVEQLAAFVWQADRVGGLDGCCCPIWVDKCGVPESILHWNMLQDLHQDVQREAGPAVGDNWAP
jgi:hypothetical protein